MPVDMRDTILYAQRRYGLSDSELYSALRDVKAALQGPLGNFLDAWWPQGSPLPDAGFSSRFDRILPWLIREWSYGRGPRPGWKGADMQLDASKVAGWANSLKTTDEALLDAMDQGKWRQAVDIGARWYVDVTQGMVPGVPLQPAATLVRWDDGASIVRLTQARDFDGEGLSMNHCLRQILHYYDDVLNGVCVILSYRDPDGVPRVTWELNIERGRPRIVQLQGPRNGPIHDPDARDRVAWMISSHLNMTEDDGVSGMWAERIGLEERRAPRGGGWGLDTGYRLVPVPSGNGSSGRRPSAADSAWGDIEDDDWEGDFVQDEIDRIMWELEDAAKQLEDAAGDRVYIAEILKSCAPDVQDLLETLVHGALISAWWEAPSIAGDAVEAWEILDDVDNVWLLTMEWEEGRSLLSWGAKAVSVEGSTFESQHMSSPLEALDAAGLDLGIDLHASGSRRTGSGSTSVDEGWHEWDDTDPQGLYDIAPVTVPSTPEAPRTIVIDHPSSASAGREAPGDRDRMMEDLTRMLDDREDRPVGEDDPFDPSATIERGRRGSHVVRTPEECILPHPVFASRFPLSGS